MPHRFAARVAPLRISLMLIGAVLSGLPAEAADVLRGHGGPVRAIGVLNGGRQLVTGAFDHAIIVWDLRRGVAERVLRFHEGSVNAVLILNESCFATGSEDGRIAMWCGDAPAPQKVLNGHQGPVTSLALSPDGERLVSGSFDATVRIWNIDSGSLERTLEEHKGPVTSVRVTPDGSAVLSGGFDGLLRSTPLLGGRAPRAATFAAPVNALVAAEDGEIVAASSDGSVRFLTPALELVQTVEVEPSPIAALALAPDGSRVAASGLKGGVAVIDRATHKITARLVGPGLPVWSLAFDTDSRTLFTGGADRVVRHWDAIKGEPIGSVVPEPADRVVGDPNERGAVLFRACQACHTLTADGGNRAGPTLHGVFGRRIASVKGYAYSAGLKQLDIIWNAETIAKLFEVGPAAYTPGTKMPEQTITDPADRKALVDWLERVTRPR